MTKKTGKPRGRPKGSKDKKSARFRQAVAGGQAPLDYLLTVMRNTTLKIAVRVDAAKAAAPYVHSRLQSIVVQEIPYDGDPNTITNEQLAHIIAGAGSSYVAPTAPGSQQTH